ncbi:MAG: single-stranded-DNA-specific exonuclease RecJ [Rhodobacteraceae bacterium]|uniref:single-stranded-DNA-specific exonuclease RecJ n=1 Tax=Albidovulum sp. TaxID=1872424 RepID=UPI001DFB33D8|nr:single-stranded-DNA-specific exonuclease RecJ [Paracoccaceae bacterium]HPE26330.1 single-stranded-DNA-specific exonuclease RecJ [Albidovulum sp.]MCB2133017.1 single-stranded-DNA-specific exonuclease RecJ [Paracoccaceae bacterium]MCB2141781.1 single-stranded-DNA-specific exonuclease RecJ [Paracoccaceae bacterium]MCB2152075.1 single-stranded-DNA-specific exonuclease RecJ [Paracoccaceae bacterium]
MTQKAYLNVEHSVTGRRWLGPTAEADRLAEGLAQETRLPLPLARILVARGVTAPESEGFLEPQLRELLPDPRSLMDMETAAGRFLKAVRNRERIAVFADYDVDGGASAALVLTWLRGMGHGATLYIPDRIDEGYGPNVPAMAALAAAHDLIVCVDCGTLSHDPVAAAKGADVVILDHHLGGETLPPALAVVNPNRQDETGALSHLCAASVVFLMLVEVNRLMRDEGTRGPDLMALLDLVALATVADVAPLVGVNRAFVRQGLRVLARRERIGLRTLADLARMDKAPTPYHLGFLLGPRINAGGRIGAADLGARLLATDDPHEAQALAERLDALNTERREIEARVRDAALAQAETRGLDAPLVWAAGEGWHPGVVGIVAARLKEATNRPAVVIGLSGDEGKGSGRSVAGVDLGAAVHRLAAEGFLLRGGGHPMAAGLTVARDGIEPAMARLSDLLARQGAGAQGPRTLRLDGLVMPGAATAELIEALEKAGPFGQGAPAPRFALPSVEISHSRRIGEAHLRLTLSDGMSARLEAVAFNAFTGPLGPFLEAVRGRRAHVAGRLELNHWQGRTTVQLRLEDAAET